MADKDSQIKAHYPAIWISDIHLRYRQCKAEFPLDFLKTVSCDRLYLVGDVINMWAMKRSIYWPKSHYEALKKIIKIAQKETTRVIYIPGNHDEPNRDLAGNTLLGVEILHWSESRQAIKNDRDSGGEPAVPITVLPKVS